MSLHAQLSPEALERLRNQQRNNTITSIIISILILVLIGVTMFWFLIPSAERYEDDLVAYQTQQDEKTPDDSKPEIQRPTDSKPTQPAPSSAMAKIITSNSASSISIPTATDVEVSESADFGDDLSLDTNWDVTTFDAPAETKTSFFGNDIKGERILYIIDYSKSMNAKKKHLLMREELEKSVRKLPGGTQFQLMFFAGPVWLAGESLEDLDGASLNTITTVKGKKLEWKRGKTDGKVRKVDWLNADKATIKEVRKYIQDTPLVLGTRWEFPLEMALKMRPKPQAIIFMTDGVAGGNSLEIAKEYADIARREKITISAVALMEPRAKEAMIELGKTTYGSFAIIGSNGRKEESEDFSKNKK